MKQKFSDLLMKQKIPQTSGQQLAGHRSPIIGHRSSVTGQRSGSNQHNKFDPVGRVEGSNPSPSQAETSVRSNNIDGPLNPIQANRSEIATDNPNNLTFKVKL